LDSLALTDGGGQPLALRGVSLAADGSFAVVVAGQGGGGGEALLAPASATAGGLTVVDLADPAHPRVAGSVSTGDPFDVELNGRAAYVADLDSGFTVVDLADLDNPVFVASAPLDTGGRLEDIALAGNLAFGADVVFVNGVPILAVDGAQPAVPRAILDFSGFDDENGSGIAVDDSFVYLTAGFSIGDEQSSGGGRLFIGRYRQVADDAGIPPAVAITSPADGSSAVEGSNLTVTATASDDVLVAAVDFLVDGATVATDSTPPYQAVVRVPEDVASVTLGARAVDF